MLARYRMIRGKRPADDPLPDGIRQNTQHRTNHCLRPDSEAVEALFANLGDAEWKRFTKSYLAVLERRWSDDRSPFDELAALATRDDVYLGCHCPTRRNPDVERCHTILALQFMQKKYPDLEVRFPHGVSI